jgi:hypothetical protein
MPELLDEPELLFTPELLEEFPEDLTPLFDVDLEDEFLYVELRSALTLFEFRIPALE